MKKNGLVRTLYLYIFSLLGLVLLIIGGAGFIDLGLKAYVFTKAEDNQRYNYGIPPYMPEAVIKATTSSTDKPSTDLEKVTLTQSEKEELAVWVKEYKSWQESYQKIDYVAVERHRTAAWDLSLIIIGLPLYLFHWLIICREGKEKNDTNV